MINISSNKNATASSVEAAGIEAVKAVDGLYITRWASQCSDPQWICVGLGSFYEIIKVVLDWDTAHGKSYTIQISDDGLYWTDVYSTAAGNGGVDNIPLTVTTRYVRMYGTERGTEWDYSLWEFKIE